MSLTLLLLAALVGAFAFVVAALVKVAVVVAVGGVPRDLATAVLSYRPHGLPPWLTVAVPVGSTAAIFGGLAWLDRWRRGLLVRRFEAGLRTPPDDVRHTVANLAQVADAPTPTVRVADTAVQTSFTTGVRAESARITVTRGLLERLSDDELRAVLAHELSHVKNRDASVMTAVTTPVVIAEGLWTIATTDDEPRTAGRSNGRRTVGRRGFEGVLLAIVGIVAALFWIAARLAVASLARRRELAADRGAAAMTGDPAAVAAALRRLDGDRRPAADLRAVGIEAFAIVPFGDDEDVWATGWRTPLNWLPARVRRALEPRLRYHPDTDARIERLQELQQTANR